MATIHQMVREFEGVLGAIDTQSSRINAVARVYNDLYSSVEEGTASLRKLDTHEALFISAVDCISREANRTRAEGRKTWGAGTNAYAALANLSYRSEAAKLEEALASYKAECERREGFEDECDELFDVAAE